MVGFAAESKDLLDNAAERLKSKGLDFIAANDISAKDPGSKWKQIESLYYSQMGRGKVCR